MLYDLQRLHTTSAILWFYTSLTGRKPGDTVKEEKKKNCKNIFAFKKKQN